MAKISKKKKNELRQKPVEVLKSILKNYYRRMAFASTRGDWACIDRDSPMMDFIEQFLKKKKSINVVLEFGRESEEPEEKEVENSEEKEVENSEEKKAENSNEKEAENSNEKEAENSKETEVENSKENITINNKETK